MKLLIFIFLGLLINSCYMTILPCQYTNPEGKLLYDFSHLTHQNGSTPYMFQDIHQTSTGNINYTYYFNFCGDLKSPTDPDCSRTVGPGSYTNFQPKTGDASAFYVDHNKNNECHRLGGALNSYTLGIDAIDHADYSQGLIFTYTNGDQYCNKPSSTPNQCDEIVYLILQINFRCVREPHHFNLTGNSFLSNNLYRIDIASNQLCGTNCPVNNGVICGGRGMCGWDYDNFKLKCFCNENYFGYSCNEKFKATHNPVVVAVVFIALFVVTLSVSIGYIFYKLKRINVNPDAYESLEKRFNELGQLASQ